MAILRTEGKYRSITQNGLVRFERKTVWGWKAINDAENDLIKLVVSSFEKIKEGK